MRAERRLARLGGLSAAALAALDSAGLRTCADVLFLSENELVQRLDLYLSEVREVVAAAAAAVLPPPQTALQLLHASAGSPSALRTGHVKLDEHLRGGLPTGSVSELVGPAGVGKTQLCLTVAARAILDGAERGARVVYVDAEHSFSPVRLIRLLQNIGAEAHRSPEVAEQLAARLTVLRPTGWAECAEIPLHLGEVPS